MTLNGDTNQSQSDRLLRRVMRGAGHKPGNTCRNIKGGYINGIYNWQEKKALLDELIKEYLLEVTQ